MVVIMTWVNPSLNGIDIMAALCCEGSAFEKQGARTIPENYHIGRSRPSASYTPDIRHRTVPASSFLPSNPQQKIKCAERREDKRNPLAAPGQGPPTSQQSQNRWDAGFVRKDRA
jgi:hypothetical protein